MQKCGRCGGVLLQDVLEEVDGPMLEHGLKDLHGSKLVLPRNVQLRPDQLLLEKRYAGFRAR